MIIDCHGHYYDDTKRYIDASPNATEREKEMIFSGNARRVYAGLKATRSDG